MADIEAHARAILLKAQRQAEALLVEAQSASEVLKAEAYAQGLAEGKKHGLEQGRAEGAKVGEKKAFDSETTKLTSLVTTLQEMTLVFDTRRQELIDRADAEVLPLALAITRKVTRRLGALDPRVVEANLKEAVRLVVSKHNVLVAVHPSQLELIEQTSVTLKKTVAAIAEHRNRSRRIRRARRLPSAHVRWRNRRRPGISIRPYRA